MSADFEFSIVRHMALDNGGLICRSKLAVVSKDGILQILTPQDGTCDDASLLEVGSFCWILTRHSTTTCYLQIDVGGGVDAMVRSSTAGRLHIAGQEHLLQTWDVATQTCIWQSKNVPHNFLDMREDYWASGVVELELDTASDMKTSSAPIGSGNILATSMRGKAVYIYDQRARKRPVHCLKHKDGQWPYTTITARAGEKIVWVGDTVGDVYHFDLRKEGRVSSYHGGAGSVRGLQAHPTLPLLMATGLDRYMRVYDTRDRRLVSRVYLKQHINCLAVVPAGMQAQVTAAAQASYEAKTAAGDATLHLMAPLANVGDVDATVSRIRAIGASINKAEVQRAGPGDAAGASGGDDGEASAQREADEAVWAKLDANASAVQAAGGGAGSDSDVSLHSGAEAEDDSGSELDDEWGVPDAAEDGESDSDAAAAPVAKKGSKKRGRGGGDSDSDSDEDGMLRSGIGVDPLTADDALVDSAKAEHRLIMQTIKAQRSTARKDRKLKSAVNTVARTGALAAAAPKSKKSKRRRK